MIGLFLHFHCVHQELFISTVPLLISQMTNQMTDAVQQRVTCLPQHHRLRGSQRPVHCFEQICLSPLVFDFLQVSLSFEMFNVSQPKPQSGLIDRRLFVQLLFSAYASFETSSTTRYLMSEGKKKHADFSENLTSGSMVKLSNDKL